MSIVKVIDLVPGRQVPLRSVDAVNFTYTQFWNDHVRRHEPVVIKGAASHWRAVSFWRNFSYLASRSSGQSALPTCAFNTLPLIAPASFLGKTALDECLSSLPLLTSGTTYSIPAIQLPPGWHQDIESYSFLEGRALKKPHTYLEKRAFIYKNASTEWHCHDVDETLTTQLVGTKRVSLFRLDNVTWPLFAPLLQANFHHIKSSNVFFPQDHELIKYEGLIAPGDTLYLPPFWWHGVDPTDEDPGITLAHCFASPLRNWGSWEEPAVRARIGRLFRAPAPIAAIRIMANATLCSIAKRLDEFRPKAKYWG